MTLDPGAPVRPATTIGMMPSDARVGTGGRRRRGPETGVDRAPDEDRLLETVRQVAGELRPSIGTRTAVRIDSRLDADLGLDSLALVELRTRVERAFGVVLPDRVFDEPTPEGWLRAVRSAPTRAAEPAPRRAAPRRRGAPAEAGAEVPAEAATLLEVLDWHTRRHPDRVHVRLLHASDDEAATATLTYGALASAAAAAAGGLQHQGLRPGESVALMLPTATDYFPAFLGVVMAGGIPVPIYPPARPAGLEDHLHRQAHILDNAEATVLLTKLPCD